MGEQMSHFVTISIRVNTRLTWKFSEENFDSSIFPVAYLVTEKGEEVLHVYVHGKAFHSAPAQLFPFHHAMDVSFSDLNFDFITATREEKSRVLRKACKIIIQDFQDTFKDNFERLF